MERQLQRVSCQGICFDGNDTLCLAQFMQRIGRFRRCREKCIVHIQGRYVKKDEPANEIGFPAGGEINGYIRRIKINTMSGEEKDAGGSNATFEDIAATRVSFLFFGIPKTWEKLVAASDFALYDIRMTHDDDELRTFVNASYYPLAIAVAKHLRNELAAETLVNYLRTLDRDAATMEKLTDAARSLEDFCRVNEEYSYNATCALLEYINSNISRKQRRNSVIYAIEALGYVALPPNERARQCVCKSLSELLGCLRYNAFRNNPSMYWHMVWASLVTLQRITEGTPRIVMDTGPIIRINHRLVNGDVLNIINPSEAGGIIQKLMVEVVNQVGRLRIEDYLDIFRLNQTDFESMVTAGNNDKVTETKRLGNNLTDLIKKLAPKIAEPAENLTAALATSILMGFVKGYFHLP